MKNKEIEELLNELKEVTNSKKLSSTYCITNKHWQLLLSYIEQLKEEIKEYEFLINMQNSREYRSKFLKEFQKEHGTNVFPDYDEIYKRYDKLKEENKQLEKENKILKENAKHNDKVVDKVNWEINTLKHNRDKARKMIFDNYGVLDKYEIEMLDDILKGDSDE